MGPSGLPRGSLAATGVYFRRDGRSSGIERSKSTKPQGVKGFRRSLS